MDQDKILFGQVFKDVFAIMWREKSTLGILTFLGILILVIWMWPMLEVNYEMLTALQETDPEDQNAQLTAMLQSQAKLFGIWKYIFVLMPIIGILLVGIAVIWSRASILGHKQIFEGGGKAFFRRTFKSVWRTICSIGWAFLLMLGMLPIWMILASTMTLEMPTQIQNMQDFDPLSMILKWQIILMYVIMFFVFGLLNISWITSLHGEGRDFKLPIHKAFQALKGYRLQALALTVVIYLLFQGWLLVAQWSYFDMGNMTLANMIPSQEDIIPYLIISIVGYIFYFFSGFALLTLGAIYASKLVPELK